MNMMLKAWWRKVIVKRRTSRLEKRVAQLYAELGIVKHEGQQNSFKQRLKWEIVATEKAIHNMWCVLDGSKKKYDELMKF